MIYKYQNILKIELLCMYIIYLNNISNFTIIIILSYFNDNGGMFLVYLTDTYNLFIYYYPYLFKYISKYPFILYKK